MGMMKREMERQDGLEAIATAVAIELKALKRCEDHEVVVDVGGDQDEVKEELKSRRERGAPEMEGFNDDSDIDDAVTAAFENAGPECGYCAKNAAE